MIAFGEAARKEARLAIKAIRSIYDLLPIVVFCDQEVAGATGSLVMDFDTPQMAGLDDVQRSRWVKVHLGRLSPFAQTCYLDADTRIYGRIDAGFEILSDGWDLVITPSGNQGDEVLWHVGAEERGATLERLAHVPVQLQGGVLFWNRNEWTRAFFDTWRDEWRRWQGQDQGALLRALARDPLRVWLLGRTFNGGVVIGHRFGTAR